MSERVAHQGDGSALDLDAIEAREKCVRPSAVESAARILDLERAALSADHVRAALKSAADVPALVAKVRRLRDESALIKSVDGSVAAISRANEALSAENERLRALLAPVQEAVRQWIDWWDIDDTDSRTHDLVKAALATIESEVSP